MKDFLQGMSRALPVVAGFLPIAMSFGAVSMQAGLSQSATVGMSVWVLAGTAQFAAIEGIRQQLSEWSIVLTMLVINLRHIAMSLAARKIYSRFSLAKQILLFHGLLDETFALELSEELRPFSYYIGMHLCCWAAWVIGTWLGCQLGVQIPAKWLVFALPGLFLCLLTNSVKSYGHWQILMVLAVGIALVLATKNLGSFGILLSIIGVAVVAAFCPGLNQSSKEV
jgi:4-azaleucine resistance transporter AzlC